MKSFVDQSFTLVNSELPINTNIAYFVDTESLKVALQNFQID